MQGWGTVQHYRVVQILNTDAGPEAIVTLGRMQYVFMSMSQWDDWAVRWQSDGVHCFQHWLDLHLYMHTVGPGSKLACCLGVVRSTRSSQWWLVSWWLGALKGPGLVQEPVLSL
jgi:hypothetical protein